MSNDDVEYTPRRRLEGTLSSIQNREKAVRTLIQANQKADRNTIRYLQGYFDALNLVTDEIRQAKDADIMGVTPNERESPYDPDGIDDEAVRETMKVLVTDARRGNFANVRMDAEGLAEYLEDSGDDE